MTWLRWLILFCLISQPILSATIRNRTLNGDGWSLDFPDKPVILLDTGKHLLIRYHVSDGQDHFRLIDQETGSEKWGNVLYGGYSRCKDFTAYLDGDNLYVSRDSALYLFDAKTGVIQARWFCPGLIKELTLEESSIRIKCDEFNRKFDVRLVEGSIRPFYGWSIQSTGRPRGSGYWDASKAYPPLEKLLPNAWNGDPSAFIDIIHDPPEHNYKEMETTFQGLKDSYSANPFFHLFHAAALIGQGNPEGKTIMQSLPEKFSHEPYFTHNGMAAWLLRLGCYEEAWLFTLQARNAYERDVRWELGLWPNVPFQLNFLQFRMAMNLYRHGHHDLGMKYHKLREQWIPVLDGDDYYSMLLDYPMPEQPSIHLLMVKQDIYTYITVAIRFGLFFLMVVLLNRLIWRKWTEVKPVIIGLVLFGSLYAVVYFSFLGSRQMLAVYGNTWFYTDCLQHPFMKNELLAKYKMKDPYGESINEFCSQPIDKRQVLPLKVYLKGIKANLKYACSGGG